MTSKSGFTKKTTDWLGREKEEHFDSSGKKVGETRFTTDWKGSPKQEHYDTEGNKSGETKRGSDWLGRDRAVHFDSQGKETGHSRDETDWLGKPVQHHYSKSSKKVGTTRKSADWLGRPKKEHTGTFPKAQKPEASKSIAATPTSSSSNQSTAHSGYSKGDSNLASAKEPKKLSEIAFYFWYFLGGGTAMLIGWHLTQTAPGGSPLWWLGGILLVGGAICLSPIIITFFVILFYVILALIAFLILKEIFVFFST